MCRIMLEFSIGSAGGVANFLGERPIEFPEIAWRSLALIKVAISNFRKLSRIGLELGLYPITES